MSNPGKQGWAPIGAERPIRVHGQTYTAIDLSKKLDVSVYHILDRCKKLVHLRRQLKFSDFKHITDL